MTEAPTCARDAGPRSAGHSHLAQEGAAAYHRTPFGAGLIPGERSTLKRPAPLVQGSDLRSLTEPLTLVLNLVNLVDTQPAFCLTDTVWQVIIFYDSVVQVRGH
jgi:hypothetical protein